MATKSATPSDPTGASEPVKATNTDQQDISSEATKSNSAASAFVNSEPIREDQVQNAVKFLSHPRVQGSAVIYRRSFLEKKGLTKEEIDEAFRRVPDPQPSTQPNTQPSGTSQGGQVSSSASLQAKVGAQTEQGAAGLVSSTGTMQRYWFNWSHAFLAIGFFAASGAGVTVLVKKAIIPRFKSWIRKIVLEDSDVPFKRKTLKPDLAEEAAAAAKAAAAAAADVAKASQEMFILRNQERRYFEEFLSLLNVQLEGMKSISNALQKMEGNAIAHGRVPSIEQGVRRNSVVESKQPYVNGRSEIDSQSVISSSPPKFAESMAAPHPQSYMEIISMIQRGEKPPNIKEIDDSPPNPNQQLSNPRLAPRPKPWEIGRAQNSLAQVLQSQKSSEEVSSMMHGNGFSSQSNGYGSVPSWEHRSTKITDVDTADDLKVVSLSEPGAQPIQRKWVSPQPPPVVMPEAAEAIRRPKPRVQEEQLSDNDLRSHSSETADELQRITKISESGGAAEVNRENSIPSSVEITKISELGGAAEVNRENSIPSSVEIQEEHSLEEK